MSPATTGAVSSFSLDSAWQLHPQVAIRPEAFGALAYHFGTRRLSFLKSPRLKAVVESLAEHASARDAAASAGVTDDELMAFTKALETLAETRMIIRRADES